MAFSHFDLVGAEVQVPLTTISRAQSHLWLTVSAVTELRQLRLPQTRGCVIGPLRDNARSA